MKLTCSRPSFAKTLWRFSLIALIISREIHRNWWSRYLSFSPQILYHGNMNAWDFAGGSFSPPTQRELAKWWNQAKDVAGQARSATAQLSDKVLSGRIGSNRREYLRPSTPGLNDYILRRAPRERRHDLNTMSSPVQGYYLLDLTKLDTDYNPPDEDYKEAMMECDKLAVATTVRPNSWSNRWRSGEHIGDGDQGSVERWHWHPRHNQRVSEVAFE